MVFENYCRTWYIYSMRNNRGQNAVEYVLLVVAVLTILIIFLSPHGKYKSAVENTLFSGTVNQIQGFSNEIHIP